MFTEEQFKKVTGVSRNASAETLENALTRKVAATAAAEIATALLVRMLVDEHQWKISESAPKVGLSASAAGKAGARGRILYSTGYDSAAVVWAHLQAIPSKDYAALFDTVNAMANEDDRTAYVVNLGTRNAVAQRLGDNATPERVTALTDAIQQDGHRTPVAIRASIPSTAKRLEIPLPVVTRDNAAGNKVDSKPTSTPTAAAPLAAVEAFTEDRAAGSDDENPFALTDAEALALSAAAVKAVGALMRAGRYAEVAAVALEIETMMAEASANA